MKKTLVLWLTVVALAACESHDPIRIGFIGGLSDRNSDTGQAGLNAVQMAVGEVNRQGGIHGRLIELLVRDDAQKKEVAAQAAQELAAAKVEAVIGPFSSGMAEVIVPVLGEAGIFEVSPTITSMAFYGKDDNLFRINRTTRDNAGDYARILVGRGQRHIAVAYDLRNRNFTESWLNEFRQATSALGTQLAAVVPYESSENTDFSKVVDQMLSSHPDGLFFISAAVDVARLSREARKQAKGLPIGASEWAGTEQLTKLGGQVVDGLLIIQNHNRNDTSATYQAFADGYQQRYRQLPGYSSVMAHDAATVILTALRNRKKGESLKNAALRSGPYAGLQQEMVFDGNGDSNRNVYFTEIRQGNFVLIPQ